MNQPVRVIVLPALCAAAAISLLSCSQSPSSLTFVAAPPGPADLGPATGLSTPPADAVVFDLKYRAQTGGADDISYFSYWGYGSSDEEAKTNSFLADVRKQASQIYCVQNPSFPGRKWAAVEYHGQQATAFYFDLNADGKLGEKERILPTGKASQGVDFITPDFINPLQGGGQVLCRTLLQANFYGGNQPNCMWSPAALLEGTATLNGQPARLLLFANGPGGALDQYGSSSYSLLMGDQNRPNPRQYVPRETLSSLVSSKGQFYHLNIEGRRSNGLPARVLLTKDTSPTGELAVKLAGSNAPQATLTSLYLHGVDDQTVFFRVGEGKDKMSLPEGAYALSSGTISYGSANAQDWEVSLTEGPRVGVKAGQVFQVTLGQPTLKVRAVEERDRYNPQATESKTFKRDTPIYLEPRVLGLGREVFSRFQQTAAGRSDKVSRAPKITITGPDGKQVLSSTMEYG